MMSRKVLATAFGSLVIFVTAQASVIDFESFIVPYHGAIDVSSPFVLANAGGSGVDVTLIAGEQFRIWDLGAGNSSLDGQQALLDYSFSNTAGTTIEFSSAISGFSLDTGDFGSDNDSPLTLKLYDGSDNLLDTVIA
ncbi:MAG: hypothetical protein QOJ65_591, partial [Fimbriimonadaceae bacterium]|nr:hypothetical protein [Fimbriimonadaceae bacterium]